MASFDCDGVETVCGPANDDGVEIWVAGMPHGNHSQAQACTGSSALAAEPPQAEESLGHSRQGRRHMLPLRGCGLSVRMAAETGVRASSRTRLALQLVRAKDARPKGPRRAAGWARQVLFYCGAKARKIVSCCAIAASDGSLSGPDRNLR